MLRADVPASGAIGWYDLGHTAGLRHGTRSVLQHPSDAGPHPATRRARVLDSVPVAPRDEIYLAFGRTPDRTVGHTALVEGNGAARCGPVETDEIGAAYCEVPNLSSGPYRMLTWARNAARSAGSGCTRGG